MEPSTDRSRPGLLHRPVGIALASAGIIVGTGAAMGAVGLLALASWGPAAGVDGLPAAGVSGWTLVVAMVALAVLVTALWSSLLLARARAEAGRERERAEAAEAAVRRLGQYHLTRRLGVGGMGEVYLARHALLRRPAAVKVMRGGFHPDDVARFEREVQVCCRLTHPNTITIYDYGQAADGALFYAMEYLEGLDLETLVERHGPLPPSRVVHVLVQACGSLAEAHRLELVHRDIKPANIMLCNRGGAFDIAKVLDFGLVKNLAERGRTTSSCRTILGTPEFMAPEIIAQSPDADGRVDIYALGCVGYYLLTGRPVFDRPTTMETLRSHLDDDPRPPSHLEPGVPADLEAVLMRALGKHPGSRQRSMRELRRELMGCAAARCWTQEDAHAWWDRHPGPESASAAMAVVGGDGLTIEPERPAARRST